MKTTPFLCALTALSVASLIGCGSKHDSARSANARHFKSGSAAAPHGAKDELEAEFNTEEYDSIQENQFLSAKDNPLSTFSVDVDTASYANVRRMLKGNQMPPAGAVRIEEFINYFDYEYPQPDDNQPFSVTVDVANCPWKPNHQLARIGLKGVEIEASQRPAANLVFLLDVSGSMNDGNKLPLVKQAMKLLAERLNEQDRVSIVVYAGSSGLVMPPTPGHDRGEILGALERLSAGGSTNGGEGIELAYDLAERGFIQGGINRVILCSDGDFNVGITNRSDLVDLIQDKAKGGVQLTVLGFGMGNFKDATMEQLADKGNGNYGYVDTMREARKLLVEEMTGTLITIAKDVKIQVDFNPAQVAAYRLIGYENRMLAAEDFRDDTKDAGEIGAGHTVTALYELQLVDSSEEQVSGTVEPTKYQQSRELSEESESNELFTVRLRYKKPDATESQEFRVAAEANIAEFEAAPSDFRFVSAVAMFGLVLRDSQFKGDASLELVKSIAAESTGQDHRGYRREFLELVDSTKRLRD